MCEMIVEDAICVLNDKAVFKKQDLIDGQQYFIMHDKLKKKVKDILNEKNIHENKSSLSNITQVINKSNLL